MAYTSTTSGPGIYFEGLETPTSPSKKTIARVGDNTISEDGSVKRDVYYDPDYYIPAAGTISSGWYSPSLGTAMPMSPASSGTVTVSGSATYSPYLLVTTTPKRAAKLTGISATKPKASNNKSNPLLKAIKNYIK